jgi:hypothetical protein
MSLPQSENIPSIMNKPSQGAIFENQDFLGDDSPAVSYPRILAGKTQKRGIDVGLDGRPKKIAKAVAVALADIQSDVAQSLMDSPQDNDIWSDTIAEMAKAIKNLADVFDAGFDEMELRMESIVRMNYNTNCLVVNAGVRDNEDVIRALVIAPGVIPCNEILPPDYPYVPPNFPQNLEAFMTLTDDEIDTFLLFYSLPTGPTGMSRLRNFLGVPAW